MKIAILALTSYFVLAVLVGRPHGYESVQAAETGAPRPSFEIQSLTKALVGNWSIAEKYEPDKWTPKGGLGSGQEVWRPGPGGLTLIEEYHSKNPVGESFGLAVTWWDTHKGMQVMWCADGDPSGCDLISARDGMIKWDTKNFVLVNEFDRDGKTFVLREVFSEITPNSFLQTLDLGEKGRPLKRWLTIRAMK